MMRALRALNSSTTQTNKDKIKNVLKQRLKFVLNE